MLFGLIVREVGAASTAGAAPASNKGEHGASCAGDTVVADVPGEVLRLYPRKRAVFTAGAVPSKHSGAGTSTTLALWKFPGGETNLHENGISQHKAKKCFLFEKQYILQDETLYAVVDTCPN